MCSSLSVGSRHSWCHRLCTVVLLLILLTTSEARSQLVWSSSAPNQGGFSSVSFSSDGTRLASSHYDVPCGTIWNVDHGSMARSLDPRVAIGLGLLGDQVLFSPEGKLPASASILRYDGVAFVTDYSVMLFDISIGTEVRRFLGHTDYVTIFAFSPNGELLASASWDMTIRPWDVASSLNSPGNSG